MTSSGARPILISKLSSSASSDEPQMPAGLLGAPPHLVRHQAPLSERPRAQSVSARPTALVRANTSPGPAPSDPTEAVDLAWEMICCERGALRQWQKVIVSFERLLKKTGPISERGRPIMAVLATLRNAHEALARSVAGVTNEAQLFDPKVWRQAVLGLALLSSGQLRNNYRDLAANYAEIQAYHAALAVQARVSLGGGDEFALRLSKPVLTMARLADLVDNMDRISPSDQLKESCDALGTIVKDDTVMATLIERLYQQRVETLNHQMQLMTQGRIVAAPPSSATIIWTGRLAHGLRQARHEFAALPGLLCWTNPAQTKLLGYLLLGPATKIAQNDVQFTVESDGTRLKLASKSVSSTRTWIRKLTQAAAAAQLQARSATANGDASVGMPFNVHHKIHVNKELVWSGNDLEAPLFTPVRKIGEGAFGAVFEVFHNQLKVTMAAKVVGSGTVKASDAIRKEIDILTVVRHPNIVAYYGTTLDKQNQLWVLMDLCEGGSVHQLAKALSIQWSEPDVAYICHGTLLALAYLHQNRILHRDVKGRNILISRQGQICLTDFGVSKRLLPSVAAAMISGPVGTPYWMSPEVAAGRGSRVSWPSDIWSLAVTAMELADGHPPYFELTPQEAMRQIADGDPPVLDNPGRWSSEFRDFLAVCLQKDPDRRPKASALLRHPFILMGTQPYMRLHMEALVQQYLAMRSGTASGAA